MQSGGNQILSHMMWNKIELQKLTRDRGDYRQNNITEINSGIEMMLSQNWVARRPSEEKEIVTARSHVESRVHRQSLVYGNANGMSVVKIFLSLQREVKMNVALL